jgi:hypothetical protein
MYRRQLHLEVRYGVEDHSVESDCKPFFAAQKNHRCQSTSDHHRIPCLVVASRLSDNDEDRLTNTSRG